MTKSKRSHKKRKTGTDECASDSDIEEKLPRDKGKQETKNKLPDERKRKTRRDSEEDSSSNSSSSSSSSSTSTDSSSDPESATSKSKINPKTSKTIEKHSVSRKSLARRHSTSAEPERRDKGGEHPGSKWDSPDEERRRRRSRSRPWERSRARSQDREKERQRERRTDCRNERSTYNNRDRVNNERGYQEREAHRYRTERSRDNRHSRNRYNDRKERSRSPRRERDRNESDCRLKREKMSPPQRSQRPQHHRGRRGEAEESYEWGKKSVDKSYAKNEASAPIEKEKPNFGLSGALTEDTNKVNGVVVKYAEPPEARKPKRRWRLYPFKGETALPTLHIHRQSCFLVGRDRKVVDLAVDHPSCSKQHAALQYRLVPFEREDGSQGKRVRLYLIDLESANGTFLNNKKIDPRKYYELIEKDVIKFGFSTREYVLLHENSKEDQEDDDVIVKQEAEEETVEANP